MTVWQFKDQYTNLKYFSLCKCRQVKSIPQYFKPIKSMREMTKVHSASSDNSSTICGKEKFYVYIYLTYIFRISRTRIVEHQNANIIVAIFHDKFTL